MKKTLFLLIVTASLSFADEIYLQTGFVIKNVTARDTVDNYLMMVSSNGEKKIVLAQIIKIVRAEVDLSKGPIMEQFDETMVKKNYSAPKSLTDQTVAKYEQPHLGMVYISVVSIILAYDNIDQVSRLSKYIDETNKRNKIALPEYRQDVSTLESEKTKRTVLGVAFGMIAIANLVYSLEKVEIKTDMKSLSLSYTF